MGLKQLIVEQYDHVRLVVSDILHFIGDIGRRPTKPKELKAAHSIEAEHILTEIICKENELGPRVEDERYAKFRNDFRNGKAEKLHFIPWRTDVAIKGYRTCQSGYEYSIADSHWAPESEFKIE